jgi:Ca-activated chloride channel family protein
LVAFSASAEEGPGEGILRVVSEKGESQGLCSLRSTSLELDISGDVVRAQVTQVFENPLNRPIEAVYAFPLPERAAVNAFEFKLGERVYVGSLKTRAKAKEVYTQARDRGESAALLEQERPNLFTHSVANIPAKGTISVTLVYVDTLRYDAGSYHLAFPLTIGPKYIPASMARSGDADRVTPPFRLDSRPGRGVSITARIDAGVPLKQVSSTSHALSVSYEGTQKALVTLAPKDDLPNRDFLLSLSVDPSSVVSGYWAHAPEAGEGFVKLLLVPPAAPPAEEVTPKELIFVLDTSGSMMGAPMETSKAAMRYALQKMNPRDTFAILRYSDTASSLSAAPLANTPANQKLALDFVNGLAGEGGTNALSGVRAAFAYPHDASRLRVVVFLTDGFIGNEDDILREVKSKLGDARLFSVGIGSSVNRYLIRGMAEVGRGADLVLTLRDKPEEVAARLHAMIGNPYAVGLSLDWGGLAVKDVSPAVLPDLFAGQPLTVFARYDKAGTGTVTLRGTQAGKAFALPLSVSLPAVESKNEAAETLWARRKIEDLTITGEHKGVAAVESEITALALKYRLLSRYTSFVAVEFKETPGLPGEPPLRVEVPQTLPEGVQASGVFLLPDGDGDGVVDESDACPQRPAATSDGCPERSRVVLSSSTLTILDRIYFEPGKAKVNASAAALLDAIAQVLKEHPEITRLRIDGHASGGEAKALALSKRRAEAVVSQLVARGIDPARLLVSGGGAGCPLNADKTSDEKAKNRRIEFTILIDGEPVGSACPAGKP